MWLSAIKIAVQAGSKIYSNRQKAKDSNVRSTITSRRKTSKR